MERTEILVLLQLPQKNEATESQGIYIYHMSIMYHIYIHIYQSGLKYPLQKGWPCVHYKVVYGI